MRVLAASFLLLVPGVLACSKKTEQEHAPPKPSASILVPISSAVSPSLEDAGSDAGSAMVSRKIPAGGAPNGTWTIEFGLERVPGDENLDWSGAINHCREKGKELCLETQWLRACELDPEVGKLESWTLTADYPGAAVRGGAEGCKTRAFRKVSEKKPERAGLCCDRAVAVIIPKDKDAGTAAPSEPQTDEFRTAVTKRILEVEAGLRDLAPTGALSGLLSEKVTLDGVEYPRDLFLTKLAEERKADPERLQFYDHCSMKMSEEPAPQLLVDCGVVQRNLGRTRGFAQRIAFASQTGPIVYLGDPKGMKPKERKERVRDFLPSE